MDKDIIKWQYHTVVCDFVFRCRLLLRYYMRSQFIRDNLKMLLTPTSESKLPVDVHKFSSYARKVSFLSAQLEIGP